MLIGARTAAWSGGNPTARDYVQDGLVVHFDGIENAGLGLPHDPNASLWAELTGRSVTQRGATPFVGYAAEFNGYANINTGIFWNYSACTVEAEFLFDNFNDNMCVVACTSTGGFSVQYENKNLFFAARDNSTNSYKFSYFESTQGTFSRYAFTAGNGAIKKYVGSSLIETIPFSSIKPPTQYTLRVGSLSGGSSQFLFGKIKYLRIYNRVLNAAEIAANYAIDKERFGLP